MTQIQAQTIRWIYPARRWQVDVSQHRTLSSYPILQPVISTQIKQASGYLNTNREATEITSPVD
jgi:hypothetical protein